MALSIRNSEVERLARELARSRKISVTEAIRQSLEREAERERKRSEEDRQELLQRLIAIAESAAAIPDISDRTEDEILGYDEFGIPTQPK
jgi:antitoxin VapB